MTTDEYQGYAKVTPEHEPSEKEDMSGMEFFERKIDIREHCLKWFAVVEKWYAVVANFYLFLDQNGPKTGKS